MENSRVEQFLKRENTIHSRIDQKNKYFFFSGIDGSFVYRRLPEKNKSSEKLVMRIYFSPLR